MKSVVVLSFCYLSASKQPVEGGAYCKYQEHLFAVNQCYLLLHSRTFVAVEAAVTCSGSQIKGISHQRFPVVLQGPLFGCEASTCQFSGESEEHLSTYEHLTAPDCSHTCVCMCVCLNLHNCETAASDAISLIIIFSVTLSLFINLK